MQPESLKNTFDGVTNLMTGSVGQMIFSNATNKFMLFDADLKSMEVSSRKSSPPRSEPTST